MTGRPVGSGYRTVMVEERGDATGYRLYIGRAIWQAIGRPARVDLERDGRALVIRPGTTLAVIGQRWNVQPRVALGLRRAEDLGLQPGTWHADVAGSVIRVTIIA